MLITAAHAQTAEAISAAAQAGDILLQYKVLGAVCVLLGIAVCVLLWLLLKSQDRYAALVERVVQAMVGAKAGSDAMTLSLTELRTLLGENQGTVGDLSHQISILVQKVQHGFGNTTASLEGLARLQERERDRQQDRERQQMERLQDRERGRP